MKTIISAKNTDEHHRAEYNSDKKLTKKDLDLVIIINWEKTMSKYFRKQYIILHKVQFKTLRLSHVLM